MQLKALETMMEANIASWLICLYLIRSNSLWNQDEEEDYQSFRDYASRKWEVCGRQADHWAAAGEILLDLYPHLNLTTGQGTICSLPARLRLSEGLLRPLVALKRSGYTTEDIRVVLDAVINEHPKPSARHVEDKAKTYKVESLARPPGERGPDFVRAMIAREVYQMVQRELGSDLATYVCSAVLEAMHTWSECGGRP